MHPPAFLTLTAAEKKIPGASKTLLIAIASRIGKAYGTLKTPAAERTFWTTLRAYAERCHAAAGYLPLSTAELKTQPPIRALLVVVSQIIFAGFSGLKVEASVTAFWHSLEQYSERNMNAPAAEAATGRKTKTAAAA
jgi:hypothetical protein